MLTVDEALTRILADVPRLPVEDVGLAEAYGRVLAADLVSTHAVPPWDNSAVDGYAVRAADTGDEVVLRLNEIVGAGEVASGPVDAGTATGIMTGAPMPPGADAVVMIEDSDGAREGAVRLRGRASPGQHVRARGEDVAPGDLVLRRGYRLTPAQVGAASSVGHARLTVSRRPIVAILSTGDEVVAAGRPLAPGQIWSSNNATLVGLALEAGAEPVDLGNAPDRLDAIVEALERAAAQADAIVTTGGVSVGVYDHVKEAFARIGAGMDFWRVAMKPGKPLAFGRVVRGGRTIPLFGLPGNPVSCSVNFLQFVRPWLRTAMGMEHPFLPVVSATAAVSIRERPGRASLVRVTLEAGSEGWQCRPTGTQSSGVLLSMARAHGLLLLSSDSSGLAAGERCRVQLLDDAFLDGATPAYGW